LSFGARALHRPGKESRSKMSPRKLFGVLAFVIGAAAIVMWLNRGAAEHGSGAERESGLGAEVHESSRGEAVERNAVESVGKGSSAEIAGEEQRLGPAVLIVRVLQRPDDAPVADVLVAAHRYAARSEARTNEAGEARFEFEGSCLVTGLRVGPSASTTAVAKSPLLPCGAGGERVEIVRVSAGAQLSGYVLDELQRPVSEAKVLWWAGRGPPYSTPPDGEGESSDDGHFTLTNVASTFFVAATAPDRCCETGLTGRAPARAALDGLEVRMGPCNVVTGQVVDEAGQPVADALVEFADPGSSNDSKATAQADVFSQRCGSESTRTDANGAFRVENLPARGFPRLAWVECAGYIGNYSIVRSEQPDQRITLVRGLSLSGRVWRSDGLPAHDALVRVGNTRGRLAKVRTNADGSFLANGLPEDDDATVRVHLEGEAIFVRRNVEVKPGAHPIEIELEPARSLAGHVVDENDRPAPNMEVRLVGDRVIDTPDVDYGEPTTWEWSHDKHVGYTDANGSFEFRDLYAGDFRITAKDPGRPTVSGQVKSRSGNRAVRIRLGGAQPSVTFEGRVADAFTGAPLTNFMVTACTPMKDEGSWLGQPVEFESVDGAYRLAGVEAGAVMLSFAAPGYAAWSAEEATYSAGVTTVNARLLPKRSLSVRLVSIDGVPLERRADARFESLAGKPLMVAGHAMGTTSHHAITDGVATFHGLPAERVRLRITLQPNDEETSVEFDLTQPLEGPQDVRVEIHEPRSLAVMLFVARDPQALAELGERIDPEALRGRAVFEALAPPEVEVTLRALDGKGRAVGSGSLTPQDGGYRTRWNVGGTWQDGESEDASMSVGLPRAAQTLELTAPGFRRVQIETSKLADGSFPNILLLRPR
jgi:protocatechuate 3,4-dioxygenase beta subunit